MIIYFLGLLDKIQLVEYLWKHREDIVNEDDSEFILLPGLAKSFILKECVIFKRKCYKALQELVFHQPDDVLSINIKGPPGVGKSVFLIYIICTIQRNLVYTDFYARQHVVLRVGEQPMVHDGCRLNSSLLPTDAFHLVDIGPTRSLDGFHPYAVHTIYVHSGSHDLSKTVMKLTSCLNSINTYFMPSFFLHELQALNKVKNFSYDLIKKNFELGGGTPIYTFCDTDNLKEELDDRITRATTEDIRDACLVLGTKSVPRLSLSLLAIKVEEDYHSPIIEFGSQYIESEIISRHQKTCLGVLQSIIDNSSNFQGFRPTLYESLMHKTLSNDITLTVHSLKDKSIKCFKFPKAGTTWYVKLATDMPRKDDVYYRPVSSSNETYDSFRFLDNKAFLFQVTVSDDHDIKVGGLKNFKKNFFPSVRKNSLNDSVNLIFVVPRNDLIFAGLRPFKNGGVVVAEPYPINQYVALVRLSN